MVGISAVGVVLVPKKVGLEKHLARRELPEDVSFGMILAPSWLSRNRVWKTAPGVCDHAIYAVPSYTVGLHPFRGLHPSEVSQGGDTSINSRHNKYAVRISSHLYLRRKLLFSWLVSFHVIAATVQYAIPPRSAPYHSTPTSFAFLFFSVTSGVFSARPKIAGELANAYRDAKQRHTTSTRFCVGKADAHYKHVTGIVLNPWCQLYYQFRFGGKGIDYSRKN